MHDIGTWVAWTDHDGEQYEGYIAYRMLAGGIPQEHYPEGDYDIHVKYPNHRRTSPCYLVIVHSRSSMRHHWRLYCIEDAKIQLLSDRNCYPWIPVIYPDQVPPQGQKVLAFDSSGGYGACCATYHGSKRWRTDSDQDDVHITNYQLLTDPWHSMLSW